MDLIEKMYEKPTKYRLTVYLKKENGKRIKGYGKYAGFHVDTYKNDCQIGNFGLNFWMRTKKGIDAERYSSFNHMINQIKNKVERYGYVFSGYRAYIEKGLKKRVIKEKALFEDLFDLCNANDREHFEMY